MTITDVSNVKSYTGDNSTTAFSTVFVFFESSELVVTLDGVTKTLDTDYSVTGGDGAVGTVDFSISSAPGTDVAIIIQRIVAYEQQTDFANFDGNPSDVTEKQFDLIVMQAQQLRDQADRSITVPVGSSITTDLPTPSAGLALKWNAGATALINTTTDPDTQTAAAAASASAAASSASSASTSASNASTSATNAATSETNAAASAAAISATVNTVTSTSNATTIDLNDGTVFSHTFTENTTFTFSNPAATGTLSSFKLFLTNDGTGRTPTWPAAVIWSNAVEPDVSTASEKNILIFDTIDGGTTWYGAIAAEAAA